jgi:hypothetical protein
LFQTLSASDRAGLIDNAFNLAKASLVGYDVPLKLSLYLERENHFTPWRSFDISVGYIKKMLVTGSYYGQWQVPLQLITLLCLDISLSLFLSLDLSIQIFQLLSRLNCPFGTCPCDSNFRKQAIDTDWCEWNAVYGIILFPSLTYQLSYFRL